MTNMIFTSGPTFQGTSAIFLAIETEFGWSRAVIMGVASFGRFGGTLFGPVEGFLTDKLGPAKMVLIGLTAGGVGFIFLSRIHTILMYYAAYFLLSVGFSFGGFLPSMVAVTRWLPKRRATGIALVVGGSSLGGFVVPALAWGISDFGWRTTMLWIGIVSIAVAPIFYKILSLRDGVGSSTSEQLESIRGRNTNPGPAVVYAATDFTAREALRTRAFWVISGTHALINFSTSAISAHVLLHLDDIGLNPIVGSTIIPVMAFAAFPFQIIGGIIGDKYEKRIPIAIFAAMQGTSVLVLAFASGYLAVLLFAIMWGIGFGGRTPILHALRAEYFGTKSFGTILGFSSVIMGVSMSAAPFLVGWQFDVQETYRYAFFILAGFAYVAAVLIFFATKPVHPSLRSAA